MIVFAQTMIDGKNEGIHGFLVQIRDLQTHAVLPGVRVEDMGYKMGCNGVDNGNFKTFVFFWFACFGRQQNFQMLFFFVCFVCLNDKKNDR